MKIATLNPRDWGYPAYVVTMDNGKVIDVIQASYSAGNVLELHSDMDWTKYSIKHYEIGTTFHEYDEDAYPEDDPGYCFYEYFEPTH